MFRKLFLTTLIGLAALCGFAQHNQSPAFSHELMAFAWDVNIPVNNGYISKTSYDGWQLEYRKMIKSDLSVGLELNWAGYYQYIPRQTHQLTHGAITSDFYKYLYTVPMALTAHHYFWVNDHMVPYAGLGLGATYSEEKLYYNTYVTDDYSWGFLVRPEVGLIYKFSALSGTSALLGVRYNYSTNKQSQFNINGISSLGFQLGIMYAR
jgi:opacity protein-like surface antigen